MLQIDENKPEDVETKNQEDHAGDEWRYSLVSRHQYIREIVPKARHKYMSFDYIVDLDQPEIDKSIYRL